MFEQAVGSKILSQPQLISPDVLLPPVKLLSCLMNVALRANKKRDSYSLSVHFGQRWKTEETPVFYPLTKKQGMS